MEGLSVQASLDDFTPRFNLNGLAIVFQKGGISIIGVLLREQIKYEDEIIDTYNGLIIIKVGALNLAALGAYCKIDGQPSLFIYGFIGAPLGGIHAFFVTGLAGGFGYNRELKVPGIDKVNDFPFVSVVTGQEKLSEDPFAIVKKNQYLHSSITRQWFFNLWDHLYFL